eukprot:CAMPEP_0119549742 /NCGR_PEP_ID=MMETSP1352-20130426/3381_1 /TAXON_ID=265584 /ORGANISM="Stauroneis constricta, Strain CCMP1120" /LENGTH=242 /DNA_ID=CAMNT_0007595371 /DNA_START=132 /DNA_END=860 /DNA_ORIENTATION=+
MKGGKHRWWIFAALLAAVLLIRSSSLLVRKMAGSSSANPAIQSRWQRHSVKDPRIGIDGIDGIDNDKERRRRMEWTEDVISLQPSMFVAEHLEDSPLMKEVIAPILLPESKWHRTALLALEVYLIATFPVQRMSTLPARFAMQLGGRSAGSSKHLLLSSLGSLVSPLKTAASRVAPALMQSRFGRAVVQPVVTVGRVVRKAYRNRSKLSVASELTYYADLPVEREGENEDSSSSSAGRAATA